MKKGFTLIELLIVVAICGILATMTLPLFGLLLKSSEGSRVGVITKLSKSGSICKTWEAEMMVGAVTGNQGGTFTPDVWRFTPEDAVVNDVKAAMISGKRVEVEYNKVPEFRAICKSDTGYFATAVKPTGN